MDGRCSPMISATIKLPNPEKIPLIVVICTELLELSILVQLFSSPQQEAALSTNSEPILKSKLPFPSKLKAILAIVTRTMAKPSFLEIASLKIKNAIREVATRICKHGLGKGCEKRR